MNYFISKNIENYGYKRKVLMAKIFNSLNLISNTPNKQSFNYSNNINQQSVNHLNNVNQSESSYNSYSNSLNQLP